MAGASPHERLWPDGIRRLFHGKEEILLATEKRLLRIPPGSANSGRHLERGLDDGQGGPGRRPGCSDGGAPHRGHFACLLGNYLQEDVSPMRTSMWRICAGSKLIAP